MKLIGRKIDGRNMNRKKWMNKEAVSKDLDDTN